MVAQPRFVRAAVVQAAPVAFDTEHTLEKAESLTGDAAGQGPELIVFPEAFVSAYPRGSAFGAVVGNRTPEGREQYRIYWDSAIGVPGPTVDRLSEIARENRAHVVIGAVERDGGTLYYTVLFFASDGRYLGKHRKLMPTASERLIWGFGDGSTLPVFETPLGRLGAAICWENYLPLLRMTMYAKGIQLYCAPTADARNTWIATVQHIALEGRCFVLSFNQFCRRSDYPKEYDSEFPDDLDTVLCRGGSCIVDPLGRIIAGPDFEGETILCAKSDMGEIARGKFDFDVAGRYARPDVFRLYVNEQPQPAAVVSAPVTQIDSH